jgi:glycosyltransferase involved in cell wall biosynthesis
VYKIEPYTAEARKESRAHAVRDVVSKLASRVFGSNIDLVVAQNNAVAERFAEIGKEAIVFPNVVVKSNLSEPDSEFRHSNISQGMTVLCVGHLIARKRFEVAISVLSRPALDGATLLIAGAPLPGHREYLQAVAEAYEVADRVKFLGKLPRERVLAEMAKASVLFHPSGREGASGVVGEATFVGIPVVCFAKTGASSVLEASDSAGLALDAGLATLDSLAEAVVVGASMPRKRSDMWTEGRFDELISDLVERARVGRDRRSLADE